jgi:hypothetical protein
VIDSCQHTNRKHYAKVFNRANFFRECVAIVTTGWEDQNQLGNVNTKINLTTLKDYASIATYIPTMG